MRTRRTVLSVLGLALAAGACGPPRPPVPPLAPRRVAPVAAVAAAAKVPPLRGARYCEVLIADRSGLQVAVDIYSTAGLNDCPAASFRALDAGRLADDLGAAAVVVKGPRYWTVDAIEGPPRVLDQQPRVVGGLELRRTGRLQFSVFDAAEMQRPYRIHALPGDGAFVFEPGQRLQELIGPDDTVYVMLSFSIQKAPLTAPTLTELAQRLKPPAGWRVRTRLLAEAMRVGPFPDGHRVVQDELDNVYLATR